MIVNIKKRQPSTLEDLKVTVENIVSGMPEELLRKMARQTRKRAALYLQEGGGHFEHLL